jgi:hypothetical protein
MNDKTQHNAESATTHASDLEDLLDDLYSLQNNLLSDTNAQSLADSDLQVPESLSEEGVHNLEIPILSDVVDDEVDGEKQLGDQFNRAQQHLFEKPAIMGQATIKSMPWSTN